MRLCPLTDLAADDRGPHDQAYELVQYVVGEGDKGFRAGESQGHQAGPQLLLHGALAEHGILEPEWKGPFLQDVHQGEEFVQVGVLVGDQG